MGQTVCSGAVIIRAAVLLVVVVLGYVRSALSAVIGAKLGSDLWRD